MPITSSSISSSDRAGVVAPVQNWARFTAWLAGGATALFAVLALLSVVLDPYDTGRFALLKTPGTLDKGPRTANASRARDPDFDAAIIGNSHIQLVSPAALTERTGHRFASLIVPGTGPGEQLIVLDYWLRTHRGIVSALVIGTDGTWCTADPALPFDNPFPSWLYDPDPRIYLKGLLRYDTLGRLPRRLSLAAGTAKPIRPDGYWDYDAGRSWHAETVLPALARREVASLFNPTGRYPAIEALGQRLDDVLRGVPVILVRPPVYARGLGEPGTDAARSEEGCRAALAALAARTASVRLVDWLVDRPETWNPENFFDVGHYRTAVARLLEIDIAAALGNAASGRPISP